ncbi:hypothetical protein SERLA73DRAFT_124667 [Serpula lacrymans var. lacrymans S7.3]|uniref:Uncharacterized protein n=2 Tax=Serpula lacrymans var. lacrymans TaxID=341189 RepID=F8Q444_SERL3|nr:uncharacterized protein SERLADRAFT_371953 [Serpula lacrymans var. lacrymans S7.9]EGN96900.1 hypothetical protein SERLA73DRAFT_124667 [Serpula lacrymans var. lacrymans S7.3]EGO22498.1 hypothetical protein SERLADRAFT_371953 [Serpula lacrymans var. lacrymans S7.9]
MFCLRRRRKRDQDEDIFNPDAFRRQSAILVDDPPPPPPVSYNPRPPTMIERKLTNASPALAAQQGYGQPPYGGGGYDVYGQHSFGPGELVPQIRSPPPASHQPFGAYGQSPLGSPTSVAQYDSAYNQHGQLNRQPSNPTYLNRQDSMMNAPYGVVADPNAHYVDLNRSSVTPFQAAQYADITRRLASNSLNGISEEAARGYAHDQSDKPLPSPYDSSPFHDSAASPASPRAPSPVHMTTSDQHASAVHEPTAAEHSTSDDTFDEKKRPDTMYTVYEPGDAYAGFE